MHCTTDVEIDFIYKMYKRQENSVIINYSRLQLSKSDQHLGIGLILTVLSQWHTGKHSRIKV